MEEAFHTRLKRLREAKSLTVKQVANAIGTPISTYREWEYGRAIKGQPYAKLAEVLKVSLDELLIGKKPASHIPNYQIYELQAKVSEMEHLLKSFTTPDNQGK